MRKISALLLLFFVSVLIFQSSCRYKLKNLAPPRWETEILAPLVSTKLSLTELIPDSLMVVDTSGAISIVYKQNILNLGIDTFLNIPDTTVIKNVKLDSLKLADKTLNDTITLFELSNNCTGWGALICAMNNTYQVLWSDIVGLSSGEVDIDATSFFQTATISQGYLDVKIDNQLPLDLANAHLQLRNKISGTVVVDTTIDTIYSNQTSPIYTFSMAGKSVEGTLVSQLINIDIPKTDPDSVFILLTDYLVTTLTVRDIKVSEATAIFPSQTVINDTSSVEYDIEDARLIRVVVKNGKLKARVINTIEEPMHIIFTIPDATNSANDTAKVDIVLPAAPPNSSVEDSQTVDLSGYTIWLNKTKIGYNSFRKKLTGSLQSSGQMKTITLDDSIYVYYSLQDIQPSYVEGYLGMDTVTLGPNSVDLEFFRIFRDGILDLSEASLSIGFKNSIGVNTAIYTDSLTAKNSYKKKHMELTGPSTGKFPFIVKGPTLTQVGQTVFSQMAFTKDNSNFSEVLNIFPNRINYLGQAYINFDGDTLLKNNFATDSSEISVDAEINIPLNGLAKNLILSDTLSFHLENSKIGKKVKEGTFKLFVKSMFPVNALLQVYFVDTISSAVLDSLFGAGADQTILAANVNANKIVTQPKETILMTYYSADKMEKIRLANGIAVRAALNTIPVSEYLKLYNTYTFDIKLVGDFVYYTKALQ